MSIELSDVAVDLHDMTPHQPNSSGISSIVPSAAEITDYINSPILDRAAFFSNRLDQLQSSGDFATLQAYALLIKEEMQRCPISLTNNLNINDHKFVVDDLSVKVMPREVPTTLENCLPITIYGDGNCLPRCGSLLAFGEETFHEEIRLRICVEMCTTELYIQNDYLNRNITLPLKEAMNLLCNIYYVLRTLCRWRCNYPSSGTAHISPGSLSNIKTGNLYGYMANHCLGICAEMPYKVNIPSHWTGSSPVGSEPSDWAEARWQPW